MVHNGIEYADMQLIAEAYILLKSVAGYTNAELGDIFEEWNQGELKSYLIGITADIFREKDDFGSGRAAGLHCGQCGPKRVQDAGRA